MVEVCWDKDVGWYNVNVCVYGLLQLDLVVVVLYYGQEIFEGIKVYCYVDGLIWIFCLDVNGCCLQCLVQCLVLLELLVEIFVELLKQLIVVDSDWVFLVDELSLYFCLFMIGDEVFFGVCGVYKVGYYVIVSFVGLYFVKGVVLVLIWLFIEYVCVVKGGIGVVKCGGNYVVLLFLQQKVQVQGCLQVLFFDLVEGKYLEELGGMNVFLVYKDGMLVILELLGSIFEGIICESILQLVCDCGMKVEECKVSIDEWKDGVVFGVISEVFVCGIVVVVILIGQLKGDGFLVGDINVLVGEVIMLLCKELIDIQYGCLLDCYNWLVKLG